MKKFLMFFAMAGMLFCANAQVKGSMCTITGGVEPTVTKGGYGELVVNLENTNDYKVTVALDVTVVDKEGNEVQRQKTVVVPARKKDKKVSFKTKKVKGDQKDVEVSECSVSIRVEKCD